MAHKIIESFKQSLTQRLLVISAIALCMTIPLNMVRGVVNERNLSYNSVISEISSLWGNQQTLAGPILRIPFIEKHETEVQLQSGLGHTETKRKTHYVRKHAFILPKTLEIQAQLEEQYRQRGIYRSLVYGSTIELHAEFAAVNIHQLSPKVDKILLEEASLLIGLSDTKAIDKINSINFNQQPLAVVAGVDGDSVINSGFSAMVPGKIDLKARNTFSLSFDVKGSHGFHFIPLGETTRVALNSTWPHPKFSGQLLPDSHEISPAGFTAYWEVPHLARNYPQVWVNEHRETNIYELRAGVDLFEPIFVYSKITRAVKYGLLFIIMTFIAFFVFEASAASALHYVQYGVVGSALAFFYLLLLALSEHIRFGFAYLLAALTCISLISVYVGYALKDRSRATVLFVLLAILFSIIYSLLNAEDFALLTGTFMLLFALGGLMYVTKDLKATKIE